MTDPERLSKRGAGLASQLLRSSADEHPNDAGVQRTLAALGVSGAVLTTTSAASASAVATSTKLTSAVAAGAGASSAGKAVTGALLLKWVGVGVVGGVGLAGAAAIATEPAVMPPAVSAPAPRVVTPVGRSARAPVRAPAPAAPTSSSPGSPSEPAVAPRAVTSTRERPAPEPPDALVPLAAEVAHVDRARALLAAGQSDEGLAQLARYEREFPQARLLPEVLFLELETYRRLGRTAEARRAAERLVAGFPKSPHAARARAALGALFP